MRSNKILVLAASALALASVLGSSTRSDACGAAISWEIRHPQAPERRDPLDKPPMELLLGAEQKLDQGDAVAASVRVLRAFPRLSQDRLDRASPLETRAMRDMAVAIVRSSGATSPSGASAWSGPGKRAENLAWATRTLRELARKDASDPMVMTNLGEALVAVGSTEDEGREILEGLAAEDLLATSYGYEALARERGAAGDAEGMTAALSRCQAMATDKTTCRAELSGSTGTTGS